MSKKTVLNEVRRFMKLANLDANLSSNFVNKLDEMDHAYMRDEEAMQEEEEMEVEDEIEVEEEPMMGDEEVDMEMDMDMEAEVEEEAVLSDEEASILIALGQKLAASLEADAEGDVEDAMDDLDDADELEDEAEELEDDAAEDLADAAEDIADETLEEILDSILGEEEEMEEGMYGGNKGDKSKTHPGEKDYTTKKGEKLKHSGAGRGEKKGDEAYVNEELVQEVLKRVRTRLAAMSKE